MKINFGPGASLCYICATALSHSLSEEAGNGVNTRVKYSNLGLRSKLLWRLLMNQRILRNIDGVPADCAFLSLVKRVQPFHIVLVQFKVIHFRIGVDTSWGGGLRQWNESIVELG